MIRTTCPRCGEVDMGPESIALALHPSGSQGTYRFVCPACLAPVQKRADRKIVALLVSAGVDVTDPGSSDGEWDASVETVNVDDWAGSDPDAPPFTVDDVLRLRDLLADQEFVARLTGQG